MKRLSQFFLAVLLLTATLSEGVWSTTDTVEVAPSGELPLYGTCNYLPESPPQNWSGMFQDSFGVYDDERLGIYLAYDHVNDINALTLYRFNMGYERIDETISNKYFNSAVHDIFRRYGEDLADSAREWSKDALKPFGYFSKKAVVFSGIEGGVVFDHFLAQGYTDKCMIKVRFTAEVVDPDDPYRYKDFFFHLEKLRKYFEKKPIITTLKFGEGVYIGETLFGVPYGQGTYTFGDGSKYVGEAKDGAPWNGIQYNADGTVAGTYSNGEWIPK